MNDELVDLIAAGYEWTCLACGTENVEIEVPRNDFVVCSKCGGKFRFNTEHAHA